jgi:hypothetical protein
MGAGKPLHVYSGKEIARALAKGSTDPADVEIPSLHDLGEQEMARLQEAMDKYEKQYDVVGQV